MESKNPNEDNDKSAAFINMMSILLETGKKNYDSLNKDTYKKLEEVIDTIAQLKSSHEICQYLYSEKRKCVDLVSRAKFKGDGLDRKLHQKFIDEIIDPQIKEWEAQLEFDKKNPPLQIINYKPLLEKQKDAVKTVLPEIIKTEEIPIAEKTLLPNIESNYKLPANFEQIICDGTEQEIMDDFMILAKTKNRLNNEIFMTEEDVSAFVKKNFSAYKTQPTGGYFEINLHFEQMTILKHFIYQFIVKYNRKSKIYKEKYALLLINNFELFKHNNPKHLASNISESKKPKSPLDVILIPKKKLPEF